MIAGSPDDVEEGFRLAHLLLTQPKVEEAALKVWREESLQEIERQKTSVESQVFEKQDELLSGGDPRLQSPTSEHIQAIPAENAQKWLDSLIAEAPVEIAVVGDLNRDKMEKLVLKYFGSLTKRAFNDPELAELQKVKVVPGPLKAKIDVPTITPRAIVSIGWRGVNFQDVKDRRVLDLAAQILSSRMQAEIREKRGLTYSVSCINIPGTSYPETGFFGTFFSADPDKVTEVAKVAEDMMLEFAKNGPSETEMQTVRNQMRNILETQQKEPSYWSRILSELDYRKIRLEDVKALVPQITNYSNNDVLEGFRKYVQPQRKIEVIGLPKEVPKQ